MSHQNNKCLGNGFCVQAFLKEVLNDLCIYNKRGANQGTYELKLEYKRNATQEDVKPAVWQILALWGDKFWDLLS